MFNRSKFHRLVQPVLESFEPRRLLSVAPLPTLDGNGILHIQGTRHRDHITVSLETDASKLDVTVNGVTSTFSTDDVHGIVATGGNGKDDIEISEANGLIFIPATLSGGNGNDTLVGGSGDDQL